MRVVLYSGGALSWAAAMRTIERYGRTDLVLLAEFRHDTGKDVSILRDRMWGDTKPMTLADFRERLEAGDTGQLELFGIGGCGCFVDAA